MIPMVSIDEFAHGVLTPDTLITGRRAIAPRRLAVIPIPRSMYWQVNTKSTMLPPKEGSKTSRLLSVPNHQTSERRTCVMRGPQTSLVGCASFRWICGCVQDKPRCGGTGGYLMQCTCTRNRGMAVHVVMQGIKYPLQRDRLQSSSENRAMATHPPSQLGLIQRTP